MEDLIDEKYFIVDDESPLRDFYDIRNIPSKRLNDSEFINPSLFGLKVMCLMSRNNIEQRKIKRELIFEKYRDPIKFSKDNVVSSLEGFAFNKNNIFYATFRVALQRLFEFGIIDMYENTRRRKDHDFSSEFVEYERKKTEVLSWNHLYAGFYLWIGACFISTIAFIGEMLTHFLRRSCEKA